MKIGNLGYMPNTNVNKYNGKQALQQPTIQNRQDSYQQRGRELAAKVLDDKIEPTPKSGQQEYLENIINKYL